MSRTVHVVDFGTGSPKVTLCPEGETPQQAFERIASNIEHFGGTVTSVRRTYPLGAAPINATEINFHDASEHRDSGLPMWHTVAIASDDEWVAKP